MSVETSLNLPPLVIEKYTICYRPNEIIQKYTEWIKFSILNFLYS